MIRVNSVLHISNSYCFSFHSYFLSLLFIVEVIIKKPAPSELNHLIEWLKLMTQVMNSLIHILLKKSGGLSTILKNVAQKTFFLLRK